MTTNEIDTKIDRHLFRKKKLEKLMTKIHHRILYRQDCIAALAKKRAISLNFNLPLEEREKISA